jgi:uncharacterized protein (DUF885 family)
VLKAPTAAQTVDAQFADVERRCAAMQRGGWTDWFDDAFGRRRDILIEAQRLAARLGGEQRVNAALRLDSALFRHELQLGIEAIDFRLHAFPVNQLLGVPKQTSDGLRIPFHLTNRRPLQTRADAEEYIELVAASEPHLRQLADALRVGLRRGIVPPQQAVVGARTALRDIARGSPVTTDTASHPIHQDFMTRAAAIPGLTPAQLRNCEQRLVTALAGPLRRGYQAIEQVLDEMLGTGRATFGVSDLPDGEAYYEHCLKLWSGTAEDADHIHRLGLAEIERLGEEIRSLYPGTPARETFAELANRLRADPEYCYPGTPDGEAAYLARVRALTGAVFERLDQVTTWHPAAPLLIDVVEPSRQSSSLYVEFYPAVAGRPSLYLVNTVDMTRLPRSQLAALAFHESVPGHHLQICTAQERTDLAHFRRRPFQYESYCEGWAMYSEQVGCELLEDLLGVSERLGCTTRRLWMAARLVVDTGIHARRWTRGQAVDFYAAHTFAPRSMIAQEVDRLAVWPGQAVSYHRGYLAFSGLRTAPGRGNLGLRALHDRVFQLGPVPISILQQEVFDD